MLIKKKANDPNTGAKKKDRTAKASTSISNKSKEEDKKVAGETKVTSRVARECTASRYISQLQKVNSFITLQE
eukprot:15365477-Ditylum_brightwellii.AAC.3